jgi:hypothetical protein
MAENSETVRGRRGRRGRRRRFGFPRPGATLSHLVKRKRYCSIISINLICPYENGGRYDIY